MSEYGLQNNFVDRSDCSETVATTDAAELTQGDALIAEWDQILVSEGLPAEPVDNLGAPVSLMQKTKGFINESIRQIGDKPSEQEVEEFLKQFRQRNPREARLLAGFALDGFLPVSNGLMPVDPEISRGESEAYEQAEVAIDVNRILGSLAGRDMEVIRSRFGIGDNKPATLDEIGQNIGVTRERVRQIEARAMAKLKLSAERGRYPALGRSKRSRERSEYVRTSILSAETWTTVYKTHLNRYGPNVHNDFFSGRIDSDDVQDVYRCMLHIESLGLLKKMQLNQQEHIKYYGNTTPLYKVDESQIEQCVKDVANERCANQADAMKMTLSLLDQMKSSFRERTKGGLGYIHRNPDVWLREFAESLLD